VHIKPLHIIIIISKEQHAQRSCNYIPFGAIHSVGNGKLEFSYNDEILLPKGPRNSSGSRLSRLAAVRKQRVPLAAVAFGEGAAVMHWLY